MSKTQDLSTMSLAELTEVYNKYAEKPIKKFSCSRDAAVAKVQAVMPKPKAKKESGGAQGIGARTIELLKAGNKPAAVLEALRKEFGEVSSMASVYWYSSKIRCGAF